MATAISTQQVDASDGLGVTEELPAGESGWAAYLREVGRERRLTPAEDLALGRRIAEGDRHALQQMAAANVRLVIAVAKQYQGQGVDLPDLVQEGAIGLLRAAQKFDYLKGYRFSTYAVWWIRQAVRRAVAKQASTMRVPTHIQEGKGKHTPGLAQPTPAAVPARTPPHRPPTSASPGPSTLHGVPGRHSHWIAWSATIVPPSPKLFRMRVHPRHLTPSAINCSAIACCTRQPPCRRENAPLSRCAMGLSTAGRAPARRLASVSI